MIPRTAIVKLRIAYCTGSGRFFILVPAVGDDHVKVASSTWSNDRSASIVPNVVAEVRNVCPIVLRTNEVGSLRTIDRLTRVVSI